MSTASRLALVPAARWLTADEVMRQLGWSRTTFFRRRGELAARATDRTDANGRTVIEYLESSLPLAALIAQGPAAQIEKLASPELLPFQVLQPAERIALPNPVQQKQAQQRLDILAPILDYQDNAARYARLQLADGTPVTSLARMIEYCARQSGQNARTLQRWLSAYRAGGFPALADRGRSDKGKSRWFQLHPQARVFAAYLYLVERMSVTFICEQLEYEAASLGIDGDIPSRETVRVFLANSISPAMKTYAREGERAYRERMAPYLKRGYTEYANQIWVGDHCIMDIEISNDVFPEVPFGTPGRLRLSAFIDYRSRKAWGTWAWEGSSRSIAATLLRGILEVGPPEHIYVDNGKDYKKVAKGAQRGSESFLEESALSPTAWWDSEYASIEKTGILARLGITVTHCIPRHPQSKHVERFFRTLHERFDAAHGTYTSGSPATRPAPTETAMMRHRWLLKRGRAGESDHPLASQVILACLAWMEDYNNTPHSGENMDGRTPNEVFAQELNPNQKPTPDPKTLALLMMDYERRKVRECAVTVSKRRYAPRADDRQAWAAMHEANETEVLVAFNATDPEYAAALTLDGHLLAWLECEDLLRFAPWDEDTQKKIGESMDIRRGMEKATKQSLLAISSAARAHGAKSAQELLYKRLELPEAINSAVTHRKPRLQPDKTAQAPASASDIAASFLEDLK